MVELDVEEVIDYTDYSNRQLVTVPLAVLAVALLVIGGWWMLTGAPVNPGIEFTGGAELRLSEVPNRAAIEQAYDREITAIRSVEADNQYIVIFKTTGESSAQIEELAATARESGFTVTSFQSTSPSFGGDTQRLAVFGLVGAFVGMSIVVFLLFRTFIPSIAVVLSAFSDIMIPVALMNLFGIELSLGTVAALLMLIGYSVDSDILLNNNILRRSGGFYESTYRAMRTGVTMTLTSLSAVIVMAIVASLFGIELMAAIGTVLAFGLAADLMNTYLMNVSLLRWYRGLDE